MASVLTNVAPVLYSAAQTVAAEPFGAVDAINTRFDNKGVSKGDSVKVPVMPVSSNSAFSAAATTTEGTSKTAEAVSVSITKSQKNSMVLTGEQIRSLENGGNYQEWVGQWSAQAMRALRNECEQDAVAAIYQGASRATGTAGQTPFASSLDDLVNARKILRDNGAPMADLQCVVDTTAEVNLFKLGIVQQAYAAGSDVERRNGILGRQFGFQISSSAGISAHTKGAGTGYNGVTAGSAIGSTTISLEGGTVNTTGIKAGDIVTFGSDTNKYVVNTGLVATSGDIVIGKPGLKVAVADATAMTIGDNYTPNLAFERNAIVGVIRPPFIPNASYIRQIPISDGKGMTYLLLEIEQYGQITWEMHLAWGFKCVQPEFVSVILG